MPKVAPTKKDTSSRGITIKHRVIIVRSQVHRVYTESISIRRSNIQSRVLWSFIYFSFFLCVCVSLFASLTTSPARKLCTFMYSQNHYAEYVLQIGTLSCKLTFILVVSTKPMNGYVVGRQNVFFFFPSTVCFSRFTFSILTSLEHYQVLTNRYIWIKFFSFSLCFVKWIKPAVAGGFRFTLGTFERHEAVSLVWSNDWRWGKERAA